MYLNKHFAETYFIVLTIYFLKPVFEIVWNPNKCVCFIVEKYEYLVEETTKGRAH